MSKGSPWDLRTAGLNPVVFERVGLAAFSQKGFSVKNGGTDWVNGIGFPSLVVILAHSILWGPPCGCENLKKPKKT